MHEFAITKKLIEDAYKLMKKNKGTKLTKMVVEFKDDHVEARELELLLKELSVDTPLEGAKFVAKKKGSTGCEFKITEIDVE